MKADEAHALELLKKSFVPSFGWVRVTNARLVAKKLGMKEGWTVDVFKRVVIAKESELDDVREFVGLPSIHHFPILAG